MATNITQKDKTLHEIIDWCKGQRETASGANNYERGMYSALTEVINHCKARLGYSGSMPSEVPNQSEDTKD